MPVSASLKRRCQLDIPAAKVIGGPHTNFPCMVSHLSLPAVALTLGGPECMQADGGDVQFASDADGLNRLDAEIFAVALNSDPALSRFVAWVRLPALGAGGTFWMFWRGGGAEVQPAAGAAFGRNAVWPDYEFVSHGGTTDSTGRHAINLFGAPAATTGPFGDSAGAISLNGSTQYGQATVSLGANSYPWTAQVWVSATGAEITGRGGILGAFDDSNAADWYSVMQDGGEVWIHERQGGNIVAANAAIPGSLTAGVWARVTGVLIDTAHRVGYLNGGSKTANDTVPFNAAFNIDRLSFGRWDDLTPSDYFGGSLAELWVRLSQPSDGRVATEFANQDDPATFLIPGAAENIGGLTAEFTATLDPITMSAASAAALAATLSAALQPVSMAGDALTDPGPALPAALAPVSMEIDAGARVTAAETAPLDTLSMSAEASVSFPAAGGSLGVTLGDVIMESDGVLTIAAEVTGSLDPVLMSAGASAALSAAGSSTLDALLMSSNAALAALAGATIILDAVTLGAAGTLRLGGAFSADMPPVTMAASNVVVIVSPPPSDRQGIAPTAGVRTAAPLADGSRTAAPTEGSRTASPA